MRNVLILGARSPVALDHARRFAAQGWRVVVGDSVPCRISGWSRAVHATARLPPARFTLREYATALNRTIREHRIELVVPTCEEVFYLSRCRASLPVDVRVVVDDLDKLATVHSKSRFLDVAQGCGALVPESRLVADVQEAREWANGRAVVVKPEFSRFGVHVRLYPEGMPADASAFAVAGKWVAQEYCRGNELCSYSIVHDGHLQAHVAYRPIYRINASSSYVFEACAAPAVRAFVEVFARKLRFTGQLSFDWIESDTGCHVLECNPRAVSGVHLFAPDAPLPAALSGATGACISPRTGETRMLAAVMLAAGFWPPLRQYPLRQWWLDFRRARDVIAVTGDRMPLLGGLLDVASYARVAAKQRCNMREASTRDTEWDGEELAAP